MALPHLSVPKIIMGDRDLEASVRLPELNPGEHYTISYLRDVLGQNQVVYGIDEQALQQVCGDDIWEEDFPVAHGVPPEDGIDGWYEYKVDADEKKAPKILEDGSVDYRSMYSIRTVRKGDVLAVYHPAVTGHDGMNVFGKVIAARPARNLPLLRGSGFERLPDEVTYVASMDGKIEMQDGRIRILSIYEMSGDVGLMQGDVDFSGDVVIHGGVGGGVTIKASGSLTIDGVVESCVLEAGKDIILRKGMIGGNKSTVKTKGSLFAQFVEYTAIDVAGDIEADVLLDCTVKCRGTVYLKGKRASLIGGEVHAVRGVKATNIGNDAETKTSVVVGASAEDVMKLRMLQKQVEDMRAELDKIEMALRKFEQLELQQEVSYKEDPRRLALLRTRIKDTAMIAGSEAEVKKLERLVSSGRSATVSVMRQVFAGTVIHIREERLNVQNNAKGVEFYYHDGVIRTRAAAE